MGRRLLLLGAVMALPTAYLACVGDSTTSGMDGGSDVTMQPDMATMGCPLGCLPPAPSGWTGPSAVYDGPSSTKPTACPSMYTQKELEAFQGLSAPSAVCDCGSPTFTGASCSASVVTYSSAGCPSLGLLQGTMTDTACVQLGNSGYVKVGTPALTVGICSFPSPTTTLPDASVTTSDISCGLPQTAACAQSPACVATPIPDAPFTRLCIHQNGDVQCPSADYAQRFVAYQSMTDSRTCSSCTGTATGGACGTSWGVTGDSTTCLTATGNSTGSCSSGQLGINAWIGGPIGATGITCQQDGGSADGGVAPAGPVTFCCNK